ncbi:hypothetical protein PV379_02675 [Streptomyces caniscabiei]|uniref:hypothetical protein n=1 Tax=Streptomyces caniscabiei TaxID=2746961 RepID=UPI0029A320F0|nr:hypothetical protein [Streptomyces caniscabiei]MDX2776260.1 hypothetical protein [Streptomyces caniscabiei]
MSERSTSTRTPDTEPKPSMYVEGAPEALQIYKIDELRQAEAEYEDKLVNELDDPFDTDARIAKRAEAQKDFENIIREHLKANGIAEDDPKFNEYVDTLKNYSIDSIPNREWNTGTISDDGEVTPGLKHGVYAKLSETYSAPDTKAPEPDEEDKTDTPEKDTADSDADKEPETDTPETDADTDKEPEPDKDTDDKEPDTVPPPEVKTPEMIRSEVDKDPAIIAARANVEEKRKKLAELTAARQGKLFSFGSTKKAYGEAQNEYEYAVIALTKLEMDAEKTAGLERDEETARLDAAFKLIGQYQEVQRQAIDIMKDTKVGKFITFMTSGGTAKRIVKGVALGAIVGVAGSLLVGATGGAAAAGVATAAGLTGRFARAYASFDNRSGRGMEVADASHRMSDFSREVINESDAGSEPLGNSIDMVSYHLMSKLEEENKREQKKRRSSTYKALGAVAAGVTLAELAGAATDHFGSRGVFGGDHNAEAKGGHDQPGGGSDNGEGDSSGTKPEAPTPEVQEYSSDARTIQNGEGFFQTMQEMDIPAEDRAELLEKVGPQLHEVMGPDGQPIAYKMPNGEWGIRMTPDGKMPTEALDLIHTTHEQMIGSSGNGIDTGSSAESTAGNSSSGGMESTDSSDTSASAETVTDTPATVESLNEPVDHSSIDVITKETLNAGDITNNTELMDLSHVATWYTPESFGQKLGLSATEWQNLESQIIAETNAENKLYTNTFEVQNGYLRFTGNRIPADTMADMLNRIPRSTRLDLAA